MHNYDADNYIVKGIARLSLVQNGMFKTPLYWIVAFNFKCLRLSQICIQSMQNLKNRAKCNSNAINLEIN